MTSADPILRDYRLALNEAFGDRIERVVLYGSRARGDAQPDSDYDVAVFLDGVTDGWAELDRLVDIHIKFLRETGAFIHARPYPAGSYEERTPLMHEIRREGLDL